MRVTRNIKLEWCAAGAALTMLTSIVAGAQNFNVTMTADNVYEIYYGDVNSATASFGGAMNTTAGAIAVPESYTLTLPDISYVYIAAWSDDSVLQGLLADFYNITNGGQVLSGDPLWEVTATGIDLDTFSPVPTLADLTTQIGLANLGTNPSGGWVPVSATATTNGSGTAHAIGTVAGIDPNARWMWYDSGLDGSSNAPFAGFNHDEYLIFRIPVSAPEPGSLVSLAIGGLCALGHRRRAT